MLLIVRSWQRPCESSELYTKFELQTLGFWFTLTALWDFQPQQAAVLSYKALKVYGSLDSQHQTAERHNWRLAGEHMQHVAAKEPRHIWVQNNKTNKRSLKTWWYRQSVGVTFILWSTEERDPKWMRILLTKTIKDVQKVTVSSLNNCSKMRKVRTPNGHKESMEETSVLFLL